MSRTNTVSGLHAETSFAAVALLAGTVAGAALVCTSSPVLMCLGAFACNYHADLLQIRSDALLNDLLPSGERATLNSVSSMVFSLVMIVMTPLAGVLNTLLYSR